MRAVVVTSRTTFVPSNYAGFLRVLLERSGENLAGVVLLDNVGPPIVRSAVGAFALGARRLGLTLAWNVASTFFDARVGIVRRAGIPLLVTPSVNHPDALAWLRAREPDLVVNARTRCIYEREVLALPRLGCINIHHGLLPEHRGTMCDLYALAERRGAGFSIHVMNERIDDGPILHREVVSPPGTRDYLDHLARSAEIEADRLAALLDEVAKTGVLPAGMPNAASAVTYAKTPKTRREVRALRDTGVRL